MNPSLTALLQHAENQRDEALASLLQAEAANRRARAQLEQLQSYHAEYAAGAPALRGAVTSIERLRSHHAFMQRLDQALEMQRAQMAHSNAQVAQRRQLLLERETRVASVRKLQERRDAQTQRSLARHEQSLSDESATQRSWRESARARAAAH